MGEHVNCLLRLSVYIIKVSSKRLANFTISLHPFAIDVLLRWCVIFMLTKLMQQIPFGQKFDPSGHGYEMMVS